MRVEHPRRCVTWSYYVERRARVSDVEEWKEAGGAELMKAAAEQLGASMP